MFEPDASRGRGRRAFVSAFALPTAIVFATTLAPVVARAAPDRGAADTVSPTEPAEPKPKSAIVDPIEVAKAKVAEGQELYEQARYEEALAAFEDAAAAYASPDFQFNIGLCYERLGEPEAAIRSFETYLRNKPDAHDRPSVEHRIDQLKAQIEREKNPSAPLTTTPTRSGETGSDRPAGTPTVQPLQDDGTRSAQKPAKPLVISGAALLAVGGVVAIGGGIGFGIVAGDRTRRVEDTLEGGNPQDLTASEALDLAKEGDLFRGLQFGSIGAGLVMAAVGAGLLATGVKRKRLANVALHGGPRVLGIGATVVF